MTINAGQLVTADDLDDALTSITRVIYRTTDQPYTSDTTLADDDTLSFSVAANTTYLVKFRLLVTGGSAGDLKTRWNVPAGVTGVIRWCVGPDSTTGASDPSQLAAVRMTGNLINADVVYALNSTSNYVAIEESAIIPVSGTAGNVTIQHAQLGSSGTATTIRARSWAECILVG